MAFLKSVALVLLQVSLLSVVQETQGRSTADEVVPLHTCRLPINDRNRNYYIAYMGNTDYFVCLKYGDILSGDVPSPSVVAVQCHIESFNAKPQIVLFPEMNAACADLVRASESGSQPKSGRKGCNINRVGYEADAATTRGGLRLTGQANNTEARLDEIIVSTPALVCTESYGQLDAAPTTDVALCMDGRLVRPQLSNAGYRAASNTPSDCNQVNLYMSGRR